MSLRNVYFVNVTLASFEFDALSVFPLSMIVIASICDKNKTQNDFCFQHYEINVIILTLQPKITQEEQSARPCGIHPPHRDSCQVTQSAMLSSWLGQGCGMTEEAAVFQTSCFFQNKAPSHFPISGRPRRKRTVFTESSGKQTAL